MKGDENKPETDEKQLKGALKEAGISYERNNNIAMKRME